MVFGQLGAFFLKKTALNNIPTSQGLPKMRGFFGKKNSLEQRTHKLGAPRNLGALFLKQKQP